MKRRDFLKTGLAAGAAAGLAPSMMAWVPTHNWDKYDFGSGPVVKDRLYQGPFPMYEPENFFGGDVFQYTMPGKQQINCFGMGMTTYISGDLGAPHVPGESLETTIDKLFRFSLGTKVYIRPNWRHLQKKAGRLDLDDYWKITLDKAAQYGKHVGFRVMMNNPDILENALPEFLEKKVKFYTLKGTWFNETPQDSRYGQDHRQPDYMNPYFLECFEEMQALLADKYNNSDLIEYQDTCMYGFWGEGHTWPYEDTPFKNREESEQFFLKLYDIQQKYWTRIPLVTNTQPDFSRVGNSVVLDKTIRDCNWIRTDSIFIENEQIEALSNRPAWIAACCEAAASGSFPGQGTEISQMRLDRGEASIAHVKDVGCNYYSLWHAHAINADSLQEFYDKKPDVLNDLNQTIGFRVRPSWIWKSEDEAGNTRVIFGMVNDGIACVPGVLRLTLFTDDGKVNISGCLDAGYPMTRGVRQAMMVVPAGIDVLSGQLKLKAELEVKGVRHPIPFAVREGLNADGSITLKQNVES